jgi:hypothetical protein
MSSSGSHRSANIPTEDDSSNGPAPTSRTSVQKVHAIISDFCEFKKFLVEQIGFAGLLELPPLTRLNLRFSMWVMSKIDPENRCIRVDAQKTIRFWAADVHKIFGIPCGDADIHSPDAKCPIHTIQSIRTALGMCDKTKSILKVAEEILLRPLSEKHSSNIEKDSFKMCFVIFVMGHLLSPSTKHDHPNIDFWGAIANTDRISDFNWCEYVIQDLFKAVVKLKNDIHAETANTHLQGCHLFAQVNHKKIDILPYVSAIHYQKKNSLCGRHHFAPAGVLP